MTDSEKTLKTVKFADFTFDKERGELLKGRRRIHLRPSAARLLTMLLDSAGSIVTREKLREELWGRKVVEWEAGLHRIAKELRSALADDARHPKFIETVARRGYRFRARTELVEAGHIASFMNSRLIWFATGALTVPGIVLTLCLVASVTG